MGRFIPSFRGLPLSLVSPLTSVSRFDRQRGCCDDKSGNVEKPIDHENTPLSGGFSWYILWG